MDNAIARLEIERGNHGILYDQMPVATLKPSRTGYRLHRTALTIDSLLLLLLHRELATLRKLAGRKSKSDAFKMLERILFDYPPNQGLTAAVEWIGMELGWNHEQKQKTTLKWLKNV